MRLERFLLARFPLLVGIGLAVIVLNAVLYATAIARLDRFTRSVKAKVADNRSQIAKLSVKDHELTGAVDQIKKGRQVLAELTDKILLTKGQRLVPVQKQVVAFFEACKLQQESASYAYAVYPQEKQASWAHRYLRVNVSVPVSGTYVEIKNFLKDLQESPQFMTVSAFSMSATAQSSAVIQCPMELTTYFVATEQDIQEDTAVKARRTP